MSEIEKNQAIENGLIDMNRNKMEKNLFFGVCFLFITMLIAFVILLAVTQPDIKKSTVIKPVQPIVNNASSVIPFGELPTSVQQPNFENQNDLNSINQPINNQVPTSQISSTTTMDSGSITVNVVNGRTSPRALYCHLKLNKTELYRVEVKDASCQFYNLTAGSYDIELSDETTVMDRYAVGLGAGRSSTIVMTAKSPITSCRDSDNGLAFDQAGIVIDQFGSEFYDVCISEKILREYYCEDNQIKQSDTTCEAMCNNGACLYKL